MKKILSLICLCLCVQSVFADSPLTSTNFFKAYESEAIVKEAMINKLSDKVIKYLNGNNPIDIKIAAINAISWGEESLVGDYENSLKKTYKALPPFYFDTLRSYISQNNFFEKSGSIKSTLSDDQLICWAYLQAMGDYFDASKAVGAAAIAYSHNEKNESYGMVTGLIIAQMQMDSDWCGVYQTMDQLMNVPDYTEGLMKQEAKDIVFEYIDLYKESCEEETESFEVSGEVVVDDRDLISIREGEIYVPEGLLTIQDDKGGKVDIKIQETPSIEYDSNIKGTVVEIVVYNTGKVASVPCIGLLENNENDDVEMGEGISYYKAAVTLIPALEPGETTTIKFEIPDYWIYDPNCEIRVTLDALNHLSEKKRKNNVLIYNNYG